jgi:hypothetical protein
MIILIRRILLKEEIKRDGNIKNILSAMTTP